MKNTDQNNKQKGITLISLIITIIVLIILSGVAIITLVGENSIINRVIRAKRETEIAWLKESVEVEVTALSIDEKLKQIKYTSSEVMEKLIENKVLNEDRTFITNKSYKLRYCGDIVYNDDEVVENVQLTKESKSIEVNHSSIASRVIGNHIITCKDSDVELYNCIMMN